MGKLWSLDPAIARLMAAQRKPKVRHCAECGAAFTTVGRGRYCRPYHRVKAARRRAKEKDDERP